MRTIIVEVNKIKAYSLKKKNLGYMYEYGHDVDKNDSTAMECYRKAGGQGHADAQFHLGKMYKHRRGVDRNYSTALE